MQDTVIEKGKELFVESKKIQDHISSISGIVQNPMLPKDVDLDEFKRNIQRLKRELTDYQNKVILYYSSMSKKEQKEIQNYQEFLKYNSYGV